MKNLLLIPLALLSFCVFAEDPFILGYFEQETAERELNILSIESFETALNGSGLRHYLFLDSGLYVGSSFAHLTGDGGYSCPRCVSANFTTNMVSAEIGWDLGQWPPFIGAFHSKSEEEINGT